MTIQLIIHKDNESFRHTNTFFIYLCTLTRKEPKNMAKGNAIELGTKPIGKLLAQYAIPAIIAMTASSLYNR